MLRSAERTGSRCLPSHSPASTASSLLKQIKLAVPLSPLAEELKSSVAAATAAPALDSSIFQCGAQQAAARSPLSRLKPSAQTRIKKLHPRSVWSARRNVQSAALLRNNRIAANAAISESIMKELRCMSYSLFDTLEILYTHIYIYYIY
jgi:hypothetical protein